LRFSLLILILLLIANLHLENASSQTTQVQVFILGPEALAPEGESLYNITVSGGPAENNGTYYLKTYLKGDNLAGAKPLEEDPARNESVNNTFRVSVRAPAEEQNVELVVEATSKNATANATATSRFRIAILSPITIRATIRNNGNVDVLDVPVKFYVDGRFVGNKTLNKLEAGKETKVSIDWIPLGLQPGSHVVTVTVDLNKDGEISSAEGEVITYQIFYRKGEEIHPGLIVLFLILAILAGLIAYAVARHRSKMK